MKRLVGCPCRRQSALIEDQLSDRKSAVVIFNDDVIGKGDSTSPSSCPGEGNMGVEGGDHLKIEKAEPG